MDTLPPLPCHLSVTELLHDTAQYLSFSTGLVGVLFVLWAGCTGYALYTLTIN